MWTCPRVGRNLALLIHAEERIPSEIMASDVREYLTWDQPVEGALFVFGGRSGRLGDARQYLRSVEFLDPTCLEWRQAPDMKFARVGLSASYLGGFFYVIGGYNQLSNDPQKSVERLDVNSMTWSDCAPLLVPRYGHSACTCREKIYVMGGDHGGILIPFAERYDPITNAWERIPDMPLRVAASRAVCIDEKIYLFGGCDPSVPGDRASDAILMFDPNTNRWTILSKRMALGRTAFSLAPLTDGQKGVVIAGGFDLSTRPEVEMRSVEVISITEEDSFSAGNYPHTVVVPPPLPLPRAGCQGVSIPTHLFAAPLAQASVLPFIVLGGEYIDPVSGKCKIFDNSTMLVNKEFLDSTHTPSKTPLLGCFTGCAMKKSRNANTDPLQWSDNVIPPMLKQRTAFAACVGKVWPKGFRYNDSLRDDAASTADTASEPGNSRDRTRSMWSDVLHDWFQGSNTVL